MYIKNMKAICNVCIINTPKRWRQVRSIKEQFHINAHSFKKFKSHIVRGIASDSWIDDA